MNRWTTRTAVWPRRIRAAGFGWGLAAATTPGWAAPPATDPAPVDAPSSKAAGPELDVPAPSSSRTMELPATGFEWGLKLGLELPLGDIDAGATIAGQRVRSGSLSGVAAFRVPVALDLGYRTSDHWWIGAEAGAGLGPTGDDCTASSVCEWSSLRLGAQVLYFFDPHQGSDPWIGAILGYEWLRGSVTHSLDLSEDQTLSVKVRELVSGPQLALQGGLQFRLDDHLKVGPFAAGALGMYLSDSFDCPAALGCPESGGVNEHRVHAWLALGVRGSHGP